MSVGGAVAGGGPSLEGWFAGRIPDDWFVEPPEIQADREEIIVLGRLPQPEVGHLGEEARLEALHSRIQAFREETRRARVAIARAAEGHFGQKMSWGARCGPLEVVFTHLAAPAMTRLRMPERRVLDTLVDSGVARSRSEALAWCVRLVGRHEGDWLADLREALTHVHRVRDRGPGSEG